MAFNYSPKIITTGLVLYLDAANPKSYSGTGTAWDDLSGRGNHATIQDAPTFSNSNNGLFTFNGTSNYITIPSSTSLTTTLPSVIIACTSGSGTPIAKGRYAVYWNYGITNVGATTFRARNDNGDTQSPTFASTSGLNIFAATWNGTSVNFYKNGIFGGASSTSYSPNANNSLFITIGCAETAGSPIIRSEFYNGSIAYIMIYNRTLSASEVLQNYNALKSRFNLG
jgi:hypothetical protein